MWARYMEALKNRPIVTNTATAFVINFVGDRLAQRIEQQLEPEGLVAASWERTWTVSCFGFVSATPAYYWFRWLDRTFPLPLEAKQKFAPRGLWMLTKKLTVHLGVFATGINAVFYGWLILKDRVKLQAQQQVSSLSMNASQSVLLQPRRMTAQYTGSNQQQITNNNKDNHQTSRLSFWEEWYAKLERDLVETMKNSVKVWGTAQSFNFLVLPAHTRVLFTNCIAVGWVAYLSVVGHRKHHEHEHEHEHDKDDTMMEEEEEETNNEKVLKAQ